MLKYCVECRDHHSGPCPRRHRRRLSPSLRGYDKRWYKLAAKAKALRPYCSRCGARYDLTVDHVDPRTKGKPNLGLRDVQVLCRSCNSSKGARPTTRGTPTPALEVDEELLVG